MTKQEFENKTGNYLYKKNDKLYCEDNLYLDFSDIESLPEDLFVVDGDLSLVDSKIKFLPDDLNVRGNLILRKSKIQSFPKNLFVYGDLDLTYTNIETIPDDIIVCGDIFINNSKIKYNPEKIGFVFSKELNYYGKYLLCYNIKKDYISLYKSTLNDFIKYIDIIYPDPNDKERIQYEEFFDECKSYEVIIRKK